MCSRLICSSFVTGPRLCGGPHVHGISVLQCWTRILRHPFIMTRMSRLRVVARTISQERTARSGPSPFQLCRPISVTPRRSDVPSWPPPPVPKPPVSPSDDLTPKAGPSTSHESNAKPEESFWQQWMSSASFQAALTTVMGLGMVFAGGIGYLEWYKQHVLYRVRHESSGSCSDPLLILPTDWSSFRTGLCEYINKDGLTSLGSSIGDARGRSPTDTTSRTTSHRQYSPGRACRLVLSYLWSQWYRQGNNDIKVSIKACPDIDLQCHAENTRRRSFCL